MQRRSRWECGSKDAIDDRCTSRVRGMRLLLLLCWFVSCHFRATSCSATEVYGAIAARSSNFSAAEPAVLPFTALQLRSHTTLPSQPQTLLLSHIPSDCSSTAALLIPSHRCLTDCSTHRSSHSALFHHRSFAISTLPLLALQPPLDAVASIIAFFSPTSSLLEPLRLCHHHRSSRPSRLPLLSAMGASSSTRRSARSTAEDVVPNLERSLEALMAWEDRAPRVKQVVTGPVVRPRQGTDVAAGNTTATQQHSTTQHCTVTSTAR